MSRKQATALAVILFLSTFFLCKERVKPEKEEANSLKEDLKDLFQQESQLKEEVSNVFKTLGYEL